MAREDVKKQIAIAVALFSIVSVILVLIGGVSYFSIKGTQEKEAQKYMKEIVSQYKNIIRAQIDGDIQTLDAVAAITGQDGAVDLDTVLSYLEEECSHNDFIHMGFVYPDRKGYFIDTDGNRHDGVDISDEDFISRTLSGRSAVSGIMKDKMSDNTVVCYGVPVIHDGNVMGAVTATRTTSNLSEIISQDIFDGIAYVHIIDREGNFVLRSGHAVINKQMDNIFEDGDITDEVRSSILADIGTGGDSFAVFHYQGNAYWVTFIPLGVNGWQIFCLGPQTFVNHNFDTVFLVFACVMACIFLLFAVLFLYIYTLLKREHESLRLFAYKDSLTGADNRNRFVSELPGLLKETADRAVVLMNISGFKFVNEFFGFEKGNLFLLHIARVLRGSIREGERYYRDNADRFGMLVYYQDREELTDEYTVSPNQDYRFNCNFGVYLIQAPGPDRQAPLSPDTVINGALLALNSVNGNTANPIAFYDEEMHEKARRKIEIASQMQAALANGEFHMYLQPKYFLEDGSLHSAEALVRWCSDGEIIHYPDEFIPIFEENGFITELDMYMLEEACRRVSHWTELGYKVRPISVNQSRIFFYDEEFLDKFRQIVDRYSIDPDMIILEVTESVAMSNLARVKMVISKLHNMGFSISMDDFGSGYSSLNTLKDLDIAELKLDKEFLSEQSTSPRGQVVIESIIHLAKALSITTVAEGIENEVQLRFLQSVSCDIGQGYYFAKPMPADEFEERILGHV